MLTCLGHNDNVDIVHEGLLRMAIWRLISQNGSERPKHLTLDIDDLSIEVHGHQGGSAYHGHVGTRITSPLTASLAETGKIVGGLLREGNFGPAENTGTWIPHLVRASGSVCRCASMRASPTTTRWRPWKSEASSTWGRQRGHSGLQKLVAPYLRRPRGRRPEQPREWCYDLTYQAGSCPTPRRVVLVVQESPDDLLLHAFFLVTNLGKFVWPPAKVLVLYRKRAAPRLIWAR
ncbi:transposase [Halomonas rhizosphaerae]|uniref:Transposase n=1 Tax=Halomonas rhizosphaerae TaxID=3043296 RepID=A0ABT6UU55_9GAMM|nr:transposase [Halomonas rhizosphaerae]MDI5889484.1 transposase [Halomonas rhizosphaerae]